MPDWNHPLDLGSDCPASPVGSGRVDHSFDSEKSITPPRPRVLFPADYEEEDEDPVKMEPKNLMQVCVYDDCVTLVVCV